MTQEETSLCEFGGHSDRSMNRENGQLHNRLWFLDDGPLPVASFRQILFFLRSGKVLVDRGIFGIARERIALWLLTISITYHEIRICIRLNSSGMNYSA